MTLIPHKYTSYICMCRTFLFCPTHTYIAGIGCFRPAVSIVSVTFCWREI